MAESNADQKEFWSNNIDRWLQNQQMMDQSMQVVLDHLLDAADLQPGHAVIDVGFGTGASCRAAADRVGPTGRVLGLDISDPFVQRAGELSQAYDTITYRAADAQDAALPQGEYDRVISRFGVMFFADTTAAFANLAGALKPGGTMTCATWGQPRNNPWFMVPHGAASARLGQPPKPDRTAPGPFAFHDPDRILPLLEAAGLKARVEVVNLRMALGMDMRAFAKVNTRTGPAASIIAQFKGSAEDAAAIEAEVFRQFEALGPGIPAELNIYHMSKG